MKFREFSNWCNDRACDGKWGMQEAMICMSIMDSVRNVPFWKRKKEWERIRKETGIEEIIEKTNVLIKEHSNLNQN